jgi:hypothetical protein
VLAIVLILTFIVALGTSDSKQITFIEPASIASDLKIPSTLIDPKSTCTLDVNREHQLIDEIARNMTNRFIQSEKEKWKLVPGQQVFYGGAFNVRQAKHFGIYIGNGIIAEVGMGSKHCVKPHSALKFKDQVYGLSTLENFGQRASARGGDIGIVSTALDEDIPTILARLERVKQILGSWTYNIVLNNCEHGANFVTSGKHESGQTQIGQTIFVRVVALLAAWRRYKQPVLC